MRFRVIDAYWERAMLFVGPLILHELLESWHSEDPFALQAPFKYQRAIAFGRIEHPLPARRAHDGAVHRQKVINSS